MVQIQTSPFFHQGEEGTFLDQLAVVMNPMHEAHRTDLPLNRAPLVLSDGGQVRNEANQGDGLLRMAELM